MAIPVPEKRISEFEDKAFGMFIHFGLYSQLGKGEWIMHIDKIAKEDYTPLADSFTAKDFDAAKIAKLAKKAGMKYITMTTRHHEGFSLYDTKGLCDYDSLHSPCGRDLVREFVDACNAEGIMPMLYHTTLDWYQPSFNDDFKGYLQYLNDSVEVLCTQYGKIGGLWFDGNWSRPNDDWEEEKLYAVIRKHQPDAIIVNNTGIIARGATGSDEIDSVTFEQGRPTPMNREGMKKYIAAEMCETMNDHWGVGAGDLNYKSLGTLIENLCACRKVGANYLLNIGPEADGGVIPMQQAMLEGLGRWVDSCGGCIYKGRPSNIQGEFKNFALEIAEENSAYLFVHDLSIEGNANVTAAGGGAGYKYFKNLPDKAKSITWTDNGEELEFVQKDNNLWVNATGYPYGTNYVVRVAKVQF